VQSYPMQSEKVQRERERKQNAYVVVVDRTVQL
jgi:hypothetical protein